MVAEKNKDWRFLGNSGKIRLMSWIKPMSNIRSASSKTKYSKVSKWMNPCPIKSSRRPGVAINISMPLSKASVWGFCPTPPNITVWRNPAKRP